MVATFPDANATRTTLFPYLTPCAPAPGIAAAATPDAFNRPARLGKRRGRWLSLLCGAAQVAAIAAGLWIPAQTQVQPVAVKAAVEMTGQPAATHAQDGLWDTLGSERLASVLLTAKVQQTQAALSAAEQERLQAQQLRLDAEARAQTLTTQAAEQARRKTAAAMRQADLIALDASYLGAEQLLFAEAGDDVTLKFAARIQCKDGRFGETAVAAPVDSRIAAREVRNLAVCYPSEQTPAGQPIGQAGDWGVAFFKLE